MKPRPEPYVWTGTCGASRSFPTKHDVFPTAWHYTHPTRFDQLRSWAARRFRTFRWPDALPGPRPPRWRADHSARRCRTDDSGSHYAYY